MDFSVALDTAENIRDKSLSDEEGSQRKVSSAQYQLFRQAVTSSKGSYKLDPAKSRRAARASLLDLGEGEVTNRVSWLDQPSLVDTLPCLVTLLNLLTSLCHGNAVSTTSVTRCEGVPWHFHHRLVVGTGIT